jgi:uncharacterized protein (TIGR03435 family)
MGRCLTIAVLGAVLSWAAHGQTPSKPPAFEVVEIKPSDPANIMARKGRMLPGGRVELPGVTLVNCIMFGYGVQENMISGAPKWASTDRYDIVAKAPPNSSTATLRPMFQTLLAEQFRLAIHREEKMQAAYVLSLGKKPAQYTPGDGGRQECAWSNLDNGLARRECHNLTMAEFARQLPGWGGVGIDAPVFDETGLKGAFDFHLDVGLMRGSNEGGDRGGERPGGAPAALPAPADSGPTIFAALEQIGLKLESRKMPVQVIVIDHAEPPK